MRKTAILLAILALAACTPQPPKSAASTYLTALMACKANWPKVTPQTAIGRAACIGQAETEYLVPTAGADADLITRRAAIRNTLAARVAGGQMTPLEASMSMAMANSQLAGLARARAPQPQPGDADAEQAPDDLTGPDANGLQ